VKLRGKVIESRTWGSGVRITFDVSMRDELGYVIENLRAVIDLPTGGRAYPVGCEVEITVKPKGGGK
jgi:hypothetical protein